MKRILVVLPVTEEQKYAFAAVSPEVEFVYRERREVTGELAGSVNAVIGNIPAPLLAGNENLEWVQLNSAGTDGYLEAGILPEKTVLTNATGAYGIGIAEHMIGQLLMLYKKFPLYLENQKAHSWKDGGTVRSVYGSRVLIVGLGDIGMEFAMRMKAFGAYIVGIRRTLRAKPDFADEIDTMDHLENQLALADVTAICLPGTKETRHLFGETQLRAMKPGSILLNVGRGNIVETDALVKVLNDGHLGGAALDVCEREPLPAGEALWNCENLLITPHVSGGFHLDLTLKRIVEISRKNLAAYLGGTPYVSVVDRKTGYAKPDTH